MEVTEADILAEILAVEASEAEYQRLARAEMDEGYMAERRARRRVREGFDDGLAVCQENSGAEIITE